MSLAKTLLLIDGAAGTGKTDLLEYLSRRFLQKGKVAVVLKVTTRARRPDERNKGLSLDLVFTSDEKFNHLRKNSEFYQYEYGGWRYGFFKSAVTKAIAEHEITVVIVRSSAIIGELRRNFSQTRVWVVYIHSDLGEVVSRLKRDGYSKSYIDLRLDRGHIAWEDYLKHPNLYNQIILNNGSRIDFERLVENLIERVGEEPADELVIDGVTKFSLPASLVGRKPAIVQRLVKSDYRRNVFLMMKFRPSNLATWEFMRDTLRERGFNCVRADQKEWNLTKDVFNPVAVLLCCKYGIALFDEAEDGAYYSPNVAYELGVMHFQRKDCLILRHKSLPAPPFDLIKDLYKIYARDIELRTAVLQWLDEIAQELD
jgi:guanylate kinase